MSDLTRSTCAYTDKSKIAESRVGKRYLRLELLEDLILEDLILIGKYH